VHSTGDNILESVCAKYVIRRQLLSRIFSASIENYIYGATGSYRQASPMLNNSKRDVRGVCDPSASSSCRNFDTSNTLST
jgi:hypothetical protein